VAGVKNSMSDRKVRFSVLDLSPIVVGGSAAESFRNTLDLAQHAERWGYERYWLAEHHGIPGVASAATSVIIAHVAGATSRIRVGSGGIMLPNHAPLVIAEQFGTLDSLFPGRIDLGIGRAPGGDTATARALRRGLGSSGETFARDLAELMAYFAGETGAVRAVPGTALNVPIYLLGSSDFSALLAAELGLPFAFASHFAPDYLLHALHLYRSNFQPSAQLAEPYAMVGVNVVAAETDEQARKLFTTIQQAFVKLARRTPGEIPPPVDSMDGLWTREEESHVRRMTRVSAVGSPETVRRALQDLLTETCADELVVTANIYDHVRRLRSFEIAADVLREIA
jgi:luciferase family oxidoreductase group 1